MRDSKALKAAHILSKYCKRHICENCIFYEHKARMPCVLNITPKFYKLHNQDKMIYHGQEQAGNTNDGEKNTTPVYVCNREFNIECSKFYCVDNGGECECTLNVNFAMKDKDGKPMIYALKRGDSDDEP